MTTAVPLSFNLLCDTHVPTRAYIREHTPNTGAR